MTKGRPKIFHDCPCCDRCGKNDEVVAFGRRKNKMKTKQVFYCNRRSTARKMLTDVWFMLWNEEPFHA